MVRRLSYRRAHLFANSLRPSIQDVCGAQPEWLGTKTRRYRPEYSNPKPLERTQNWIKLEGKVKRAVSRAKLYLANQIAVAELNLSQAVTAKLTELKQQTYLAS